MSEVRLLRDLSNAFGPSGDEEQVREILRAELESCADEVRVDKLGNIFFHIMERRVSPRSCCSAHG